MDIHKNNVKTCFINPYVDMLFDEWQLDTNL